MKIKFIPTQEEVELDPNKSLLQLCIENNIEIKSICKGVPSCAECRVKIAEGEYNIIPPNKAELSLIGSSYYLDQRRLSCQVKCFGPVTIDITEQLQKQDSNNKKVRGFKADSSFESKAIQGNLVMDEKLTEEGNPHISQGQSQNQNQNQRNQGSHNKQSHSKNKGNK